MLPVNVQWPPVNSSVRVAENAHRPNAEEEEEALKVYIERDVPRFGSVIVDR